MSSGNESRFWADQLADKIIERAEKEKRKVNIKCQQTPSGAKHIGNLNDVIRAYYPYKAVVERGKKAEFVHTTDDRDPLKNVPKKLPDLDGKWHLSRELKDMEPYLGKPLCRIPDPFGCCKTWSEHFTQVWMDGVRKLGMEPKLYSVDRLYKEGKFDPYIRMVFENREKAGELISKFQRTKSREHIPFDAVCPQCGVLANVDDFDLEKETVKFSCRGKAIRKKKAQGCGFEGEVPWSEGKLQWRFEWPALWAIFDTTYEPFGKDHYEGSWKSGKVIIREIYNKKPPIPYVYEFFLVNGEKMSASEGNVYIVQDMMKMLECGPFMYFYTKKPGKQRDLDLTHIYKLVDEYDRAERVYFGAEQAKNEREKENLTRSYELSTPKIPKKLPVQLPYSYASMLYQCYGAELKDIVPVLKDSGHLEGKISKRDREKIRNRVERAGYWVKNFAPEQYRFKVRKKVSENAKESLSESQKSALKQLAGLLKEKITEEELHQKFWDIAEENGLSPEEFFQAAYRMLIGKKYGPKLAPFIMTIGRERVRKILEKV